MIKTFIAYKQVIGSNIIFWIAILLSIVLCVLGSVQIVIIDKDLQDSILSIMSILFPLIAGFLTFGRDILRELREKINSIVKKDLENIGTPTPRPIKVKIKYLKSFSDNFIEVVISTFYISFILIVGLLIAKVLDYEFKTSNFNLLLKEYFYQNWFNLLMKFTFFSLVFMMFFNALFLVIYIVKVTKEDDLLTQK